MVQNIREENKAEELPPPTDEAINIASQLSAANQELMDVMKAFNKLLGDQTLPENKSLKDKQMEQSVVNRLATAAISVENLSPGQGLLGLSILAIRQALSLRNAGNLLAYKLHQVEEKIQLLEEKVVVLSKAAPEDAKKEYIKELAEKMGVKVSLE